MRDPGEAATNRKKRGGKISQFNELHTKAQQLFYRIELANETDPGPPPQ
jgi:hypothetical protein